MTAQGPARRGALVILATIALSAVIAPGAHGSSAGRDTDGDGLPDAWERTYAGTDPRKTDSDGDGGTDDREDPDQDALTNIWELRLGLHPRRADTDRDDTPDGNEDGDADGLRNVFELRRARTSPVKSDTDLDGLRDGVEDPDGDDLSNAGEQRYGTGPRVADTDGTGPDDWHEDSNGDGIADGLTQDRRVIPGDLRPTLTRPNDRPTSHTRCHQGQTASRVLVCSVGRPGGRRVVVIGDSHALHWRAALEQVARARGWRLTFMTKSACPIADVPNKRPSCARWREAALRRIASMRPRMVIVSTLGQYPVPGARNAADSRRKWRGGLIRTLRRLDRIAGRVVLLGDTPFFGSDPVGCLRRHRGDLSRCSVRRSSAVIGDRLDTQRSAAGAAGVLFRDTTRLACPYDPCPLVTGRTLMIYDRSHFTVAYARSIWRGLARLLPS
jgi:hypothetical protein